MIRIVKGKIKISLTMSAGIPLMVYNLFALASIFLNKWFTVDP